MLNDILYLQSAATSRPHFAVTRNDVAYVMTSEFDTCITSILCQFPHMILQRNYQHMFH